MVDLRRNTTGSVSHVDEENNGNPYQQEALCSHDAFHQHRRVMRLNSKLNIENHEYKTVNKKLDSSQILPFFQYELNYCQISIYF